MKYFVFYEDDYADNGGVGFKEFESSGGALDFIRYRLQHSEKPDVANYKLIEGSSLTLEAFARVADVRIQR